MATTKIWPVRDNLKRLVDYAGNPEKTEYTDLRQELDYVGRQSKTQDEGERFFYVTGIHCDAARAYEEMSAVKCHFGKTGGNLAYHGYQSFKPGEVTPEECHQIGVQLATQLWGDRFQVLVATHLDRAHLHNHFLLNSVSYVDGKKFNDNYEAYRRMRSLSDALCRECGLSTIDKPQGKTPRSIYFAEKSGEPTKYNLMREALDYALSRTSNAADFREMLREQGYELSEQQNRKYITILRIGTKKPTRLYHLGENYDIEAIARRLEQNRMGYGPDMLRYMKGREAVPRRPIRRAQMKGSFHEVKKVGGLCGLYLHYCYALGILPKNRRSRPLSPEMREECRRMDAISRQTRLVCSNKLNTAEDVEQFIASRTEEQAQLIAARQQCYNQLRRQCDPAEVLRIRRERDALTKRITISRGEIKTAQTVLTRSEAMRQNLLAEQEMKTAQRNQQNKNQKRQRSYER